MTAYIVRHLRSVYFWKGVFVALIVFYIFWAAGCQASTTIKGGTSEAKAVTEEVRPKQTTTTTITIQLPAAKESK